MCKKKEEKKRNNGSNKTSQPVTYQNSCRKGNQQIFRNIKSGKSNKERWKRNIKEGISQKKKKTSRNQISQQNSHQSNKYLGSPPCGILWIILKLDKRGTQTNRTKYKEIDEHAQGVTHKKWYRLTQYTKMKKRKTTLQHWGLPGGNRDSRDVLKNCPVGWVCRKHRLLLCRDVRLSQRVSWLWH